MNKDERAAMIALELLVESEPEGFTRADLEARLLAEDLVTEIGAKAGASFAIRELRREFGTNVILYNEGLGRYRSAMAADEGAAWVVGYARRAMRLLRIMSTEYLPALRQAFPEGLQPVEIARADRALVRLQVDADDVVDLLDAWLRA